MSLGKYFVKGISRRVKKKERSMNSSRVGRQSTYRNKRNFSLIFFKKSLKKNLLKILLTDSMQRNLIIEAKLQQNAAFSALNSKSNKTFSVFIPPRFPNLNIIIYWHCHIYLLKMSLLKTPHWGSPVLSSDRTANPWWHFDPSTPLVICIPLLLQ